MIDKTDKIMHDNSIMVNKLSNYSMDTGIISITDTIDNMNKMAELNREQTTLLLNLIRERLRELENRVERLESRQTLGAIISNTFRRYGIAAKVAIKNLFKRW